jgi:hypothetical protein
MSKINLQSLVSGQSELELGGFIFIRFSYGKLLEVCSFSIDLRFLHF